MGGGGLGRKKRKTRGTDSLPEEKENILCARKRGEKGAGRRKKKFGGWGSGNMKTRFKKKRLSADRGTHGGVIWVK